MTTPVFVDGEKTVTLRGANIADQFQKIVDDYVSTRYRRRDGSGKSSGGEAPPTAVQ